MLSKETALKIQRCIDDIEYFAENYVKIIHPTQGIIQLRLNDFQREAISSFNENRSFCKIAERQKGKSTVACVLLLHQFVFTDSRVSVIFGHKKSHSDELLEITRGMYQHLPDYLKPALTTNNKSVMQSDSLSKIISVGKNPCAVRGIGLSNIYIDESEFIKNLDEIILSVKPAMVSQYGKVFAFSSTRTLEHFKD